MRQPPSLASIKCHCNNSIILWDTGSWKPNLFGSHLLALDPLLLDSETVLALLEPSPFAALGEKDKLMLTLLYDVLSSDNVFLYFHATNKRRDNSENPRKKVIMNIPWKSCSGCIVILLCVTLTLFSVVQFGKALTQQNIRQPCLLGPPLQAGHPLLKKMSFTQFKSSSKTYYIPQASSSLSKPGMPPMTFQKTPFETGAAA